MEENGILRALDNVIKFIQTEILDRKVGANETLGDILRESPIGYNGAGVQFADYLKRTYNIPMKRLLEESTEISLIGAATRVNALKRSAA